MTGYGKSNSSNKKISSAVLTFIGQRQTNKTDRQAKFIDRLYIYIYNYVVGNGRGLGIQITTK